MKKIYYWLKNKFNSLLKREVVADKGLLDLSYAFDKEKDSVIAWQNHPYQQIRDVLAEASNDISCDVSSKIMQEINKINKPKPSHTFYRTGWSLSLVTASLLVAVFSVLWWPESYEDEMLAKDDSTEIEMLMDYILVNTEQGENTSVEWIGFGS